jgi:hypothetical protein
LLNARLGDHFLDQRHRLSNVIAGRKLGNYTTILRVYFNLAVQAIGQQTVLAVI